MRDSVAECRAQIDLAGRAPSSRSSRRARSSCRWSSIRRTAARSIRRDFSPLRALDELAIRRSEDALVDELLARRSRCGAPLLRANFPRAFLDVNREPYELDPQDVRRALPTFANMRSMRVAGGLGTIARIVSESEEIYARPLMSTKALSADRRGLQALSPRARELIVATHGRFGFAVLLDCHSMPSVVRGGSGRCGRTSCSATATAPAAPAS